MGGIFQAEGTSSMFNCCKFGKYAAKNLKSHALLSSIEVVARTKSRLPLTQLSFQD